MSVAVIGGSILAGSTGSHDQIESCGTDALVRNEVVDLVGAAVNPADHAVDVIGLSGWACDAEVVDEVVSWFADASSVDVVLGVCADGSACSVASLSVSLFVAADAIAALVSRVVDLAG